MLQQLSRLEKCQLVSCFLAIVANIFLVIGTVTPAWQVAEDTDVSRYVQSGLWLYCPGAAQCWYIFSDNLINYYEKVDVCRFLLIGDCRKKLLRTPYFFGWHYAVLIMNVVAISLISLACAAAALSFVKKERRRVAAIVFDIVIFLAVLVLGISLMVFVINAEMLESKYLIGVKNTFEKYYGYSFYLTCLALVLLVFAALGAVMITTFTFFAPDGSTGQDRDYVSASDAAYYKERVPMSQNLQTKADFALRYGGSAQTSRIDSPVSQCMPPANFHPGEYNPSIRSPSSDFQQTTRHFYSY